MSFHFENRPSFTLCFNIKFRKEYQMGVEEVVVMRYSTVEGLCPYYSLWAGISIPLLPQVFSLQHTELLRLL